MLPRVTPRSALSRLLAELRDLRPRLATSAGRSEAHAALAIAAAQGVEPRLVDCIRDTVKEMRQEASLQLSDARVAALERALAELEAEIADDKTRSGGAPIDTRPPSDEEEVH